MGSIGGTPTPCLRWGVLGTGWISTMFIRDLLVKRPDAAAAHTIVAVGSSSQKKGNDFVSKLWPNKTNSGGRPAVYADYQGVYNDPDVDIVYVGTPHSLHRQNCLDAIAAGKHVLCEKPLTINELETREVVDAARAKGVFLMEAMWIRFVPIFEELRKEIIEKRAIGDVQRFFMDFGNPNGFEDLPANSRFKDISLGAGALLDIGVYPLTFASLILGDFKVGKAHPQPRNVVSSLSLVDGVDASNVVVIEYDVPDRKGKKTAICTSTFLYKSSDEFARIEGSAGEIVIFGPAGSVPIGFRTKSGPQPGFGETDTREERTYRVDKPAGTLGFFWEADAVAQDIAARRTEDSTMPLEESLRMMRLMDQIRQQGGLFYPQDSH